MGWDEDFIDNKVDNKVIDNKDKVEIKGQEHTHTKGRSGAYVCVCVRARVWQSMFSMIQ